MRWNAFRKKTFRLYEGSVGYKNFKENQKGKYSCESCNHSVRLEAILISLGNKKEENNKKIKLVNCLVGRVKRRLQFDDSAQD